MTKTPLEFKHIATIFPDSLSERTYFVRAMGQLFGKYTRFSVLPYLKLPDGTLQYFVNRGGDQYVLHITPTSDNKWYRQIDLYMATDKDAERERNILSSHMNNIAKALNVHVHAVF